MGGAIRLEGSTSGYSALQAPPVAGDQTFTFPEKGGTLSVAPTGSSSPGYQSGVWKPTIQTQDGALVWTIDGVDQGGGDVVPTAIRDYNTFTWSRVGQSVTVNIWFQTNKATVANTSNFYMTNLPYTSKLGSTDTGTNGSYPFTTVCFTSNFPTRLNYQNLTALINNLENVNEILYNGETIYFQYNVLGAASGGVTGGDIAMDAQIIAQITYLTDDTTWTPKNGATVQ